MRIRSRIRSARPLRSLLALAVVSIIAVGGLTACGSTSKPPTATTPPATTPTSTATTPTTAATNADGCPSGTTIPQGGGDNDGDNSGGASDGDGCM